LKSTKSYLELVHLSKMFKSKSKRYPKLKVVAIALLTAGSVCAQLPQNKPTPNLLFELGERASQGKAYNTALAQYNECLRLDPYFWAAYFSRAFIKEKLGDPAGALTDYNIYLEAMPENMEALFSRAILRYNIAQWEMAKQDFIKLLKAPRGAGETNTIYYQTDVAGRTNKLITIQGNMKASYLSYLGLIEWKMKDYQSAITFLDSAIKLHPTGTDYWINRGIIRQSSRDTLGAIQDFTKALRLDSGNALATHNLAILSGFRGDQKESERQLTEAIEENPKLPYSYEERGFIRMKNSNWKGALADFNEAVVLEPNEPDNWLNRGITKEKLKDFAGAMEDYAQAIKLKEDYEKAWLNRGNLLSKLDRLNEAIEDYTIALVHYPQYGLAFYNRALAKHKMGNSKEACQDLIEAQRLEVMVERKVMNAICK
jgi:tetratricopeptide (TPR) repeat protein